MNTSLSCLWMLHIIYKDVKQNWLPLAALPLGAAPWRVLDLIWGFLLIITRETQSSLNVQVTAKGNLSGSEERAVTVAVTFICFLHPLLSAQTCLEWAQLPTLIQCLGAQQCQTVLAPRSLWPWDTSSWGGSPVTASAAPSHLQARTGTGTCTATPTHCGYTWQKDCVNIWKGDGIQLSPCLTLWLPTVCYSVGIFWQSQNLVTEKNPA